MNIPIQLHRQKGVALFLSLIMLLVLAVLGISSFQNSHIQERSASNARSQSVAFEAAAAGAANAINFFDAYKDNGADQDCGTAEHPGWDDATDWVEDTSLDMGEGVSLKQRMYCLADEYPTEDDCDPDDDSVVCRPARSQLFVLSRGEVTAGSGDDAVVVARRDVEVRLDLGSVGAAGDGCGAICFPTCNPGTFDFPSSNAFRVDGNGGPAITGGCDAMTDAIDDGIRDDRIGRYYGGLATTTPGAPWNSPLSVEAFRANIAAAALLANTLGGCQTFCHTLGNVSMSGNSRFGTVADPQITYIHGNASFGGNISGAGIMFVNGTLSWNGTPNFQGLIVTLGGSFSIAGGGRGGDHGGSVVILNQPLLGIGDFGSSSFRNNGGGNALYKFDCGALWAAHGLLDASGQGMWSPECDTGPASPYVAGPEELIIASWRENIGWREDFFGSDDETEE